MKELLKLSAILALICCGAALALGCVYELTKEPIARQQQLKKQRAVAAVFPDLPLGSGTEGTAVNLCVDESPACRQLFLLKAENRINGVALEAEASGYNGPINLMVGILPDGTLSAISVINHTETPGLGANITRESFYGQFSKQAAPEDLALKKDGGIVDHVTGATISSAAVLHAVRDGARFFNANQAAIISAQSRANGEGK